MKHLITIPEAVKAIFFFLSGAVLYRTHPIEMSPVVAQALWWLTMLLGVAVLCLREDVWEWFWVEDEDDDE